MERNQIRMKTEDTEKLRKSWESLPVYSGNDFNFSKYDKGIDQLVPDFRRRYGFMI